MLGHEIGQIGQAHRAEPAAVGAAGGKAVVIDPAAIRPHHHALAPGGPGGIGILEQRIAAEHGLEARAADHLGAEGHPVAGHPFDRQRIDLGQPGHRRRPREQDPPDMIARPGRGQPAAEPGPRPNRSRHPLVRRGHVIVGAVQHALRRHRRIRRVDGAHLAAAVALVDLHDRGAGAGKEQRVVVGIEHDIGGDMGQAAIALQRQPLGRMLDDHLEILAGGGLGHRPRHCGVIVGAVDHDQLPRPARLAQMQRNGQRQRLGTVAGGDDHVEGQGFRHVLAALRRPSRCRSRRPVLPPFGAVLTAAARACRRRSGLTPALAAVQSAGRAGDPAGAVAAGPGRRRLALPRRFLAFPFAGGL